MTGMSDEERLAALDRSLTNISPSGEQVQRIEQVRALAKGLGHAILLYCPDSRERSIAITNLEQSAMWAVKSIVLE